jgi:hypothetical protein
MASIDRQERTGTGAYSMAGGGFRFDPRQLFPSKRPDESGTPHETLRMLPPRGTLATGGWPQPEVFGNAVPYRATAARQSSHHVPVSGMEEGRKSGVLGNICCSPGSDIGSGGSRSYFLILVAAATLLGCLFLITVPIVISLNSAVNVVDRKLDPLVSAALPAIRSAGAVFDRMDAGGASLTRAMNRSVDVAAPALERANHVLEDTSEIVERLRLFAMHPKITIDLGAMADALPPLDTAPVAKADSVEHTKTPRKPHL